jgi:hypothetical protein
MQKPLGCVEVQLGKPHHHAKPTQAGGRAKVTESAQAVTTILGLTVSPKWRAIFLKGIIMREVELEEAVDSEEEELGYLP